MKNKKILFGIITTGLVTAITIASCDKDLNKTNPNAVTVDTYFKNSTELQKGTNAIYSVLHSNPW